MGWRRKGRGSAFTIPEVPSNFSAVVAPTTVKCQAAEAEAAGAASVST